MQAKKMERPNQGITCAVDTCYFYMRGDHCCADKIQVEPKHAGSSEETDCATFVPHRM